jgi:hypothetical protein
VASTVDRAGGAHRSLSNQPEPAPIGSIRTGFAGSRPLAGCLHGEAGAPRSAAVAELVHGQLSPAQDLRQAGHYLLIDEFRSYFAPLEGSTSCGRSRGLWTAWQATRPSLKLCGTSGSGPWRCSGTPMTDVRDLPVAIAGRGSPARVARADPGRRRFQERSRDELRLCNSRV